MHLHDTINCIWTNDFFNGSNLVLEEKYYYAIGI